MRMIILLLASACIAGAAVADVQRIEATLPGDEDFEAPAALQEMKEGVVWLDLTILPGLNPTIELGDGTYRDVDQSGFGPVDARAVSVRTGSNHMLLDVRLGTPDRHAANLLSFEYAPQYANDADPGHVTRLKGCYFAHAISIPTAIDWVLNPLPADACHHGD